LKDLDLQHTLLLEQMRFHAKGNLNKRYAK
jgi:hypothetical protein